MSKRTRSESKLWDTKIVTMFEEPSTKLVENRYRALRHLLSSKYPELVEVAEKPVMLNFLKDAVYLDRKLRLWTEDIEQPLKKELAEEFIVNELI